MARTAAWVRSETPSLLRMLRTCALTVLTLKRRLRAIWGLVWPWLRSFNTSTSLDVRLSNCVSVCLPVWFVTGSELAGSDATDASAPPCVKRPSLSSLASLTNTVHVLVGTYELLPFRNLSAQLSRRSIDIHFPRYRAERSGDYTAFRNVVFTLQRHLPLPGETDLLPHLEYCYERSIGCVGLVKDWLTRALALAINQTAAFVTLKMLQKTAWSLDQSERMAREPVDGESDVSDKEEKRYRLKQLLQLGSTTSTPATARATTPPRACPPVGQRRPVRDVVGATG